MGTMLTDCGPATRDLLTRLVSPSRNRYYYGKLLDYLKSRNTDSYRSLIEKLGLRK